MLGDLNVITTIIGFGMSSTFILFVCTRLICGRLRVEAMRAADSRSATDIEQPEQRTNGLEPVVVAAIPTMKFHRDAFSSEEDAQCSICLGEYQEKEVLRIMPKCGHSFHLSCIDIWLMKQSTCPVCRLPLKDPPNRKRARLISFSFALHDNVGSETMESSAGNASSQNHQQLTPGNPVLSSVGESEARH